MAAGVPRATPPGGFMAASIWRPEELPEGLPEALPAGSIVPGRACACPGTLLWPPVGGWLKGGELMGMR